MPTVTVETVKAVSCGFDRSYDLKIYVSPQLSCYRTNLFYTYHPFDDQTKKKPMTFTNINNISIQPNQLFTVLTKSDECCTLTLSYQLTGYYQFKIIITDDNDNLVGVNLVTITCLQSPDKTLQFEYIPHLYNKYLKGGITRDWASFVTNQTDWNKITQIRLMARQGETSRQQCLTTLYDWMREITSNSMGNYHHRENYERRSLLLVIMNMIGLICYYSGGTELSKAEKIRNITKSQIMKLPPNEKGQVFALYACQSSAVIMRLPEIYPQTWTKKRSVIEAKRCIEEAIEASSISLVNGYEFRNLIENLAKCSILDNNTSTEKIEEYFKWARDIGWNESPDETMRAACHEMNWLLSIGKNATAVTVLEQFIDSKAYVRKNYEQGRISYTSMVLFGTVIFKFECLFMTNNVEFAEGELRKQSLIETTTQRLRLLYPPPYTNNWEQYQKLLQFVPLWLYGDTSFKKLKQRIMQNSL
jgi:hypothetical protein